MKYLRWLMWSVVYLFRRDSHTLDFWLLKTERTRKPWWKFRPSVWHNDEGRQWEITLANEDSFTRRVAIPDCEIAISRDTGHIIGVTLYDEILRQPNACPSKWFGPNRKDAKGA